jgi:hypothetical protein
MMHRNGHTPPIALLVATMLLSSVPAIGQTPTASARDTAPPERFFICDGFNGSLDDTIRRYIALYPDHALIDGIEYRTTKNDLYYSLDGPSLPGIGGLGPEIRFQINRLTGSYEILPLSTAATGFMSPEWSRPEDRGCVAVDRKL